MAFTQIYLCNWALDLAQAPRINTLSDTSESARIVASHYNVILETCLERENTPWDFAAKYTQLAGIAEDPVYEFGYTFDLPGDFVALQDLWPKYRGRPTIHRIIAKKIFANETPLRIKYTSNECIDSPHLFSAEFAEFFASKLASIICRPLKGMADVSQLQKDTETSFRHAAASASKQGTPEKMLDSEWLIAHENMPYPHTNFRMTDADGNFIENWY